MSFGSSVAIYFIMWWICLFAVLPWGMRSQFEEGEIVAGTDPSAPARVPFLRVVLVNTAVSLVVFAVFYVIWTTGAITLDDLSFLPGGRASAP